MEAPAADSISHYREFLIILGAAGLVVPLFLKLGINAVLGFLLVGILLNPDVLGHLTPVVPALNALVIADPE
ncbi:MAG: potassium transporter TrkA, partial [Pseudomonadota bacterium]|nr:potassium transporter TrkA [Pseudomonadota bacterium]